MKKILILIHLTLCSLSSLSAERIGNIDINLNRNFKVGYKGELDQYVIEKRDSKDFFFMLNNWPPPNVEEDFPQILKRLADSFIKSVKDNKELALAENKYEVVDFIGAQFRGKLVSLKMEDNSLIVYFFIKGNGKIWNGICTGSGEEWKTVSEALAKLRWLK